MTTIGAIQLRLGWVGPALSRLPNWLSQAGVIPDRQTRKVFQHGTLQQIVV
jgi:hypothetical protein